MKTGLFHVHIVIYIHIYCEVSTRRNSAVRSVWIYWRISWLRHRICSLWTQLLINWWRGSKVKSTAALTANRPPHRGLSWWREPWLLIYWKCWRRQDFRLQLITVLLRRGMMHVISALTALKSFLMCLLLWAPHSASLWIPCLWRAQAGGPLQTSAGDISHRCDVMCQRPKINYKTLSMKNGWRSP